MRHDQDERILKLISVEAKCQSLVLNRDQWKYNISLACLQVEGHMIVDLLEV